MTTTQWLVWYRGNTKHEVQFDSEVAALHYYLKEQGKGEDVQLVANIK
jgi:hypothetical protein